MKIENNDFNELLEAVKTRIIEKKTSLTKLSFCTNKVEMGIIIQVIAVPFLNIDVFEEITIYNGSEIDIDDEQWGKLCKRMEEKFIVK